ncbi:MAG: RNA polymerase sigma-70 factor [Bacteroidota bacterium]
MGDEFVIVDLNNPRAFEQVFHRYYALLGRFAMSYLSDPEEARDLVQQVFVKVWEQRGRLPEDVQLRSYLYTAVRNACYNALEHKKVRQRHQAWVMERPTPLAHMPDEISEARELEQRIEAAVAALPERCQQAFLLSREEGLSYKDIALRMGISPKTVEVQMGKALKLLRQALGDVLVLLIWIH